MQSILLVAMFAFSPAMAPAQTPAPVHTDATTVIALEREAGAIVAELGARLRQELQSAMAEGGPVAAIGICHDKAIPLANAAGGEAGWRVRRTALRLRNPANAPDAWEQAVLKDFERRVSAGEDPSTLSTSAIVVEGTARQLRYMKAIPTVQACTVCHGTAVAPALQSAINSLYPEDQATGFAPGDLRGAFSLRKVLD